MSRRLILLGILFLVAAALLFVPLPIPNNLAGRTIENAGHVPLFVLVTLACLVVLRRDFGFEGARLYAIAGLIGVGAGFLSEVIQRPLRRDASWEDVLADAIGVACALSLYALFDRKTPMRRTVRFAALAVAMACTVVYAAPLVRMTRAYLHRNAQFPVLADFRSSTELFWIVGYGINRAQVGDALEVEFQADEFPGRFAARARGRLEPLSDPGARRRRIPIRSTCISRCASTTAGTTGSSSTGSTAVLTCARASAARSGFRSKISAADLATGSSICAIYRISRCFAATTTALGACVSTSCGWSDALR